MRRLCPHRLGSFVQANAQRILLLLSLALLVLCAAFNSVKLDTELSSWIQRTTRIEHELQAIDAAIGDGAGSNSLLILQTPKKHQQSQQQSASRRNKNHDVAARTMEDILSVESLMIHLEAIAIATHVSVDLYDISWSLKDICFSPTLPDYEGLLVNQMLDHLMPCAIKTPLDCFWEGSKLLGPDQEVRLSSFGPKLKWTSLNPLLMVEAKKRDQPHASFPYDTLISWMKRVGMTTGYQDRPCLDPSDPNCPLSAPNKLSGVAPNVGAELTGGCRGLATNQMHWKEDEIVGGIVRNRSGYIVRAEALQSTIQMMGERDVYDYWRKTSKVQDINNWSIEKAKLVIDAWQKRFKDELAQFTRSSVTSNAYKIHALTPKSMLEPIDNRTILDCANFKLTIILMTVFTCIFYPSYEVKSGTKENTASVNDDKNIDGKAQVDSIRVSRLKLVLMAMITSLLVVLTFIASLGLSSLMNFPMNMATTQILPPLALFYGYRQALMITSIYAKNFKHSSPADLTTECLNELLPIILLESFAIVVPLMVASIFPVQATRVFTCQAIIYIVLSSSTAIFLVPALLVAFLIHNSSESSDKSIIYISYTSNAPRECISPSLLSIKSKKGLESKVKNEPSLEDQIFSRLQEDLRNIRADSQQPTDINFSLRADGSRTSFKLTTSRCHGPNQATFSPSQKAHQDPATPVTNILPDLLLPSGTSRGLTRPISKESLELDCEKDPGEQELMDSAEQEVIHANKLSNLLTIYTDIIVSKRYIQVLICLFRLFILAFMISQTPHVRYGLQLKDIVIRGTVDYDSFATQEKYFPVYNIFAITSGDFDYPSNQRLLHEYQQRIEEVDGIVKDNSLQSQPKFWLVYFRDWLLELQDQFDQDRNRSAISNNGWTNGATDAAKMAYKLLAQTGRADNPIDKNQVESNRLVDKNGIINQKAFYYYLTAWIMNDAFTYSNSEANLKPEPKTWNENPEDLRIERARPITYAQIPYLLKLPEDVNGLETIIEIRGISQAFEQLGLQNYPTGVPFIFWDQFINLDLLFIVMLSVVIILLLLIIGLFISDLNLSIIIIGSSVVTVLELYGLLGYLSVHFNTIVAVLMLSSIGTVTIQTIQYATIFLNEEVDIATKIRRSLKYGSRVAIASLPLLLISALIFRNSKIDFMIKFSSIIFFMAGTNSFNTLILTPILFSLFGTIKRTQDSSRLPDKTTSTNHSNTKVAKPKCEKVIIYSRRKRNLQRVQSQISLSTISEEPQAVSPFGNVVDTYSQNAPCLK